MTDTVPDTGGVPAAREPGLFARVAGVVLSPRETYAAVAARPRALGVLLVVLAVVVAAQGIFLSTEVGRQATLDQQVEAMETFGVPVTDEAYARMEESMQWAPVIGGVNAVIFWPLMMAIIGALLHGVFGLLLGGAATFKQVFAIVAHSAVIIALQQLFSLPLSYARGEFAGANLGAFVPMLEETSFVARFLAGIDLFFVWWIVSLAIGVGVLYRRRTGGIATTLLGIYVFLVLVVAFWRSGS